MSGNRYCLRPNQYTTLLYSSGHRDGLNFLFFIVFENDSQKIPKLSKFDLGNVKIGFVPVVLTDMYCRINSVTDWDVFFASVTVA